MSLELWILLFVLQSLFWAWVLFWGGADILEGTLASAFLISWLAPEWSAEGIKLFAAIVWFFSALWFVLWLFEPVARIW